ncbi:DUF309 domain-containing protein [Alkalihalobacillus pseudalcaliphilus]|uniref:DUF309 domain-containing protein n=1 Tax=Alkalihalobacillus pseudalcaliphilus TaxID=79884 RepID=UPI00064DBDA9|nr:DUF309 domain-containing protein [Alkalihalobacillus pseudalcaliphilus]KMK76142.1 hypothetical protein AB990_13030 [Alkalihalobacillus pseudalcaliphilus]
MYPKPFLDYLVYFHANYDYFECHEVLEEYWKEAEESQRHPVWVGLIQLSVGLYHERRGNYAGAKKMLLSSRNYLMAEAESVRQLNIDYDQLAADISNHIHTISTILNSEPEQAQHIQVLFQPIKIPFFDQQIHELIQKRSEELGISWQQPEFTEPYIIHKHKLRDRSDVIAERQNQIKRKNS